MSACRFSTIAFNLDYIHHNACCDNQLEELPSEVRKTLWDQILRRNRLDHLMSENSGFSLPGTKGRLDIQ